MLGAVQACAKATAANAQTPNAIPCTLGINYSPWCKLPMLSRFARANFSPPITISDHVFKSDNPESTVNETAEMDLYRASLVSLQSDIAAANSQAKTDVKVGVVMLDSEVKLFRPWNSRSPSLC